MNNDNQLSDKWLIATVAFVAVTAIAILIPAISAIY